MDINILSHLLLWIIVLFLVVKPYLKKFSISIERTFYQEIPYGFSITKWKYERGTLPNSGKGIFSFSWRNPDKIIDKQNK